MPTRARTAPGRVDVLIVGGGFAGAATAFHLSRSFDGTICLVEREKVPGAHASGRNAAMVRQSVEDPAIRALVVGSRRHYEAHASEVGFRRSGSLLLGTRPRLAALRDAKRVDTRLLDGAAAAGRVAALEGHEVSAALETPRDGVVDIWALLQLYLRGARAHGVQVLLDCEVRDVSGAGPYRVETSRGVVEAGCLVNAAGAWATPLAIMAGASPLPLVPWKRHLFLLDGADPAPDWPFVWSLDAEFYFRPESNALLLSICDEERVAAPEPTVSPGISEAAAELVWKQLPALRGARQRQVWSCFRTRPPDGGFVIGRDPLAPSFFWVAGLGGHGVGSSWEVGRLAAARLREPPGRAASRCRPFEPARLRAR